MRRISGKIIVLVLVAFLLMTFNSCMRDSSIKIVYPENSSDQVYLAAKEARRYIYLRTGELLELLEICSIPDGDIILVSTGNDPLVKQISNHTAPIGGFFIKSEKESKRTALVISGDDPTSTLYAAYRFAEKLGCRFYLHGDVIPDKKISLDISGFNEQGQPVTTNGRQWTTRGIQPFQNFPAGAVMWTKDDWKMYISQLPKMGMNFLGLHTYMDDPEDDAVGDYGPTLNIWLGHENDLNPDGTVDFAFDATFFHTQQDIIGWGKTVTSDLKGGTSQLFPTDGYPYEIIGETYHNDQKGYTQSFNNAAELFRSAFSLANALGVKTATGVEIPVGKDDETGGEPLINGIPETLQSRLEDKYGLDPFSQETTAELYKGAYKWLSYNNIPVDYFWLWTTEIWMPWGGASRDQKRIDAAIQNLQTAVKVYNELQEKPFNSFATGGWVLGAEINPNVFAGVFPDPSVPFSSMSAPFGKIGPYPGAVEWTDEIPSERVKWPFTWFEFDYGLEQPQFHVYRVLHDANSAYEKETDGLIAEFWRTKMLSVMFAAYKEATWDYAPLGQEIEVELPADDQDIYALVDSVYLDWASHEFGVSTAATQMAKDLSRFDRNWDDRTFKDVTDFSVGADGIYSQGYITGKAWWTEEPWGIWEEEKKKLEWIDNWSNLRNQIEGEGNKARFDYWHNVFKVYKHMAHFSCELNQYEAKTASGDLVSAADHRSKLARIWEQMMNAQVQRVHDEVDLGEIINLQWRTWENWVVGIYDANFIEAGGTLPEDSEPSKSYTGEKFIACIPVLTQVPIGESLDVKALIMGEVEKPTLHYRTLGNNSFKSLKMKHDERGVYKVSIPGQNDDFEWYISANTSLGKVVYPASAGASEAEMNYQTVVVSNLSVNN